MLLAPPVVHIPLPVVPVVVLVRLTIRLISDVSRIKWRLTQLNAYLRLYSFELFLLLVFVFGPPDFCDFLRARNVYSEESVRLATDLVCHRKCIQNVVAYSFYDNKLMLLKEPQRFADVLLQVS